MSKTTLRLLATSALALCAAFIGLHQASAFTLDQVPTIVAQAGGSGGAGGVGRSAGPAATPTNPEPDKNSGMGSGNAPGQVPANPSAGSSSPGVPAQCAAMTNANERAACIERNRANNSTIRK